MIIRYLESLLSIVNDAGGIPESDTDTALIRECFDLVCPLVIEVGCCLLLDDNKHIISIYSNEYFSEAKKLIGNTIDVPLERILSGQLTDLLNIKGVDFYLYKLDFIDGNKKQYVMCAITFKDRDNIYLLKKINDNIKKFFNLVRQHSNYNDFLMRCLDAVEDGISVCDKDGYIAYVNNACCKMIGIDKKEFNKIKAEDPVINKPTLKKILETKKSLIDHEVFLKLKANNETIHLINSGYPVFDNMGKNLIGAINIFRGFQRSKKLADNIAGYKARYEFNDIIGDSSIIKEKINLAKIYTQIDENLLIYGESGTGKELFAQSIHNYSRRKSEPFIPINCANFPNDLIDSELFGYEDGAFTGAKKGGKPGKIELANGGTLFLDEIGEMHLHLQAKLLRVVETKTIARIGGGSFNKVDVRIIAATNRELKKMVEEGKFREDLYYRLKVLYLDIPALRDRQEDIIILINNFIKKFNEKNQKNIKGIDTDAKKLLLGHTWPGNVRELENIISRASFICNEDCLKSEHFIKAGLSIDFKKNGPSEPSMHEISKKVVLDTLKITGGNKKKAAEILGLSRPTIYKMLKEE